MENQVRKLHQTVSFLNNRWKLLLSIWLFLSIIFSSLSSFAQSRNVVKGVVTDAQQNPAVGATVALKGSTKVATIADANGKFTLSIPSGSQKLVVSFIGMESQEIAITGTNYVTVTLKSNSIQLGETIVVGFGTQKKASVVGSITQVTGKIIERN